MQRMISLFTLLLCLTLLPLQATAGWFSSDTLVTIDGVEYSVDSFKNWWQFWKDKDQKLPESPDFYVDWLLLKDEAERMDIANAPGFKRKERIFLQSRGLLMLKYEAVDNKIKVTDEQVKQRYQERYQPLWLVQQIQFADQEKAMKAWEELKAEELTVAQLLERDEDAGGPEGYGEKWLRPAIIDPGWEAIFQKSEAGAMIDPELHKKGKALFFMKEQKAGNEEDFALWKEEIRKAIWREEEDRLTAELIKDLSKKYQVKIDRERLAALDLTAEESTFTDDPVITTNKENVSEKQFMAVVRKLEQTRPVAMMATQDEEKAQAFKLETAQNIINQSVTNWGTLDRHFEKEEPMKAAYDFNYNYRLVSMLENQLFSLKEEPSGEELKKIYQERIQYFTVPEQAKLYIVDETQGPIDKLWAEVAVGKPFNQAVQEVLDHPVKPLETPVNHLDPQVRAAVEKLAEGETSPIFEAQGDQVIVHLVSRSPAKPLPLEKVKDTLISGYQRERFDVARKAYLESLRANAKIEVDQANWKLIQKELGGA